jgi:hypothetical protein
LKCDFEAEIFPLQVLNQAAQILPGKLMTGGHQQQLQLLAPFRTVIDHGVSRLKTDTYLMGF